MQGGSSLGGRQLLLRRRRGLLLLLLWRWSVAHGGGLCWRFSLEVAVELGKEVLEPKRWKSTTTRLP